MNTYLLFFGLFFPRISLFIAYLYNGIPPNTVPFVFEVFLTIFLPRALMCFYIVSTLGWNSGWLIAHLVAWAIEWLFFGVKVSKSKSSD